MAVVLQKGAVVWARGVYDPSGRNPKDRFVVLIRDVHDDDPAAYGVAITTSFSIPLLPSHISLPYARHGRSKTGLVTECVAKCEWVVEMLIEDIERRGAVSTKVLLEILSQVERNRPPRAE